MPIYEYKCNNCGHVFDIFSTSVSHEHPCCPKCKECNTKKLISPLGYMKHPDQSSPASLPPIGDTKKD